MATLVSIDVINKTIPSLNNENIPIINKPNPCYGYLANAKEVKQLIQMPNYWIYESGTNIVISGKNYYDYFPEEGSGGASGGVTKEEVQVMINESKPVVDSVVSTTSTNAIQNSTITNFVNSSISTNTANYVGQFNSIEELNAYTGTVTNNDYAFVVGEDESGNTKYDRHKWVDASSEWLLEYTLNNSSFTAEEWASIQSGVKSQDVEQIKKNEEYISNLSTNKADKTELVGKNVTGTKYTIAGTEYTAKSGAEIFNNYSNTKAVGMYSHAEGSSFAVGDYSHSEGNGYTLGRSAHAEGMSIDGGQYNRGGGPTASGIGSHAEGCASLASGSSSHAEGSATTASGNSSHSEGYHTEAFGDKSHSEGDSTYSQSYIMTITSSTTNDDIISVWRSKKFSLAKGNGSHVEGGDCLALGDYSHSEGRYAHALGLQSHAEGNYTTASGADSHAEGSYSVASGQYSHAEGTGNGGQYFGGNTTASGYASHAEGGGTKASGYISHAEGTGTVASGDYSHAEGYTAEATGVSSHSEGNFTTASGSCSHAEGNSSYPQRVVISITSSIPNEVIISAWNSKKFSLAKGNSSHVEGQDCLALGGCSHAEGEETTASGYFSHAEGGTTTASGYFSHAEGCSSNKQSSVISITSSTTNDVIISAWNSKKFSLAKGNSSHVEGENCLALGDYSHSEGGTTTASGSTSHSEGYYTKASSNYQHVQGKYNIEDTESKYAFIIGNGTSDTDRSNAFAIDWDGKIYQGDSSIGIQLSQNVDLTLEEYEALSDAEKNNGTYYNIIES